MTSLDRSSLILNSYNLAEAGHEPVETIGVLLRAMVASDESNPIVWNTMAVTFRTLHKVFEAIGEGEVMKMFISFVKTAVDKCLARVGWDER